MLPASRQHLRKQHYLYLLFTGNLYIRLGSHNDEIQVVEAEILVLHVGQYHSLTLQLPGAAYATFRISQGSIIKL